MIKETIVLKDSDYTFETGKFAKQANGSVFLKWKNMTIMANATASNVAKEGMNFFPLTVEYRERFYASGKFPGGFIKREGKPSSKEVLTSRLIDRPIRPLFPKAFVNELQLFVTLLSHDINEVSNIHAITAASAALMCSNLPFDGPVAGVVVGRINDQFVLFPSVEEEANSELRIYMAGTEKAVTMIEGSANEVEEEIMLDAVKFGHEEIKRICQAQHKLKDANTREMIAVPELKENKELQQEVHDFAFEKIKTANAISGKEERQTGITDVCTEAIEHFEKKYSNLTEEELSVVVADTHKILEELEVKVVRDQIFNEGTRADKRKLDEIRAISIDLDILQSTHGSAMFTRGETQSLGVVTLGSIKDSQNTDDIEGENKDYFYLHYNFLPYSVGEVRRYMGPGRREIGHGKLAENAIRPLVPSQEDFPYVIRIVSEILESNGSSSMATVCSASLALMLAGVPIPRSIAGIAMGLITDEDKYAVLSDIAGLEDHFGDMDFKVAGTTQGITTFQLDTKIQGISYEIMEKALEQAKTGRLEILSKMDASIDAPRQDIAPQAPKILSLRIDAKNIGALIGTGGSNIKGLMEKTNSEINVDESGKVSIFAKDSDSASLALDLITKQFEEAKVGEIYDGTVKKILNFGAFIEIIPGKDGLCHISKIADRRIENIEDFLSVGQKVRVKVLSVDNTGRINLSIKDT